MYTKVVEPAGSSISPSSELILNAAEIAFAKTGYTGSTFSEICRHAGVSRGLPSYLFGSKEELYRRVVQRAAQRLRDAVIEPLKRCSQTASIEQALTLIVDTYVDYLAANPRIVRLLQWELLSEPEAKRPFAPSSALFAEMLELLEAVLIRGGRAEVNARALLASSVSLCFFHFMLDNRIDAFGSVSADQLKCHTIYLLTRGL